MSNGIRKIKEIYLKEAEEKSRVLVQRIYPVFKQEFTGSVGDSSIGIEKYKNILFEEIKHIIALQLSLGDFQDNKIIDEEESYSSIVKKYDKVIEESENSTGEIETKDVYTKYAMLAGYGSACLTCSKELQSME